MNNSNDPTAPADLPRCPFVGLHDDPGTCLSYPSFWNYCHHARPPASVKVSHQTAACLTREYSLCPVLLALSRAALPTNLRGAVPVRKRWPSVPVTTFALLTLFLLGMAVALLNRGFDPLDLFQAFGVQEGSRTAVPTQRAEETGSPHSTSGPGASSTRTSVNVFLPITSGTGAAMMTPAATSPVLTPVQSPGATSGPIGTRTTTPVGVCGHTLDVPFGGDVRFVLHRVRSGENLSMYADQYRTTTEAILAVNYRLPVPVWEHWILVIPLDTTIVGGVPPFEPYQALEAKLSLTDLANNLGADPTALQKYNDFDESCTSFSGWILVPREADSH